jgi:hypothetical protein
VPTELVPLLAAEIIYVLACITYGTRPGAPIWLSWPARLWTRLKNVGRPKTSLAPPPDYAKIHRLERELGLVDERPLRATPVCLVKGCTDADIDELRSWGGMLLIRVHNH